MIVFASIVPHSFYLVGKSGKNSPEKLKKTRLALDQLRLNLEKTKPEVIVLISPHAQMEDYHFVINSASVLKNPSANFEAGKKMRLKNDLDFVRKIKYSCELVDHFVHLHENELDYGALVPLSFLLKNINPRIIHLSHSKLSFQKHYEYGEIMSNIFRKSKRRIAILASGELSHRKGFQNSTDDDKKGRFFDYWAIHHLANRDIEALVSMEREALEQVQECGLRSFLMMLGILYQEKYQFNLISYEYPLDVGYLVARLI